MAAQSLAEQPSVEPDSLVDDVAELFKRLPGSGDLLEISCKNLNVPAGGHLQGIQARHDAANHRDLIFLSHDSTTAAYFAAAEFSPSTSSGRILHVQRLPSDGNLPPLRHAGGIQLLGNVLVVGVEDNQAKTRSEVQFWNVDDPQMPKQLTHLTLKRRGPPKEQTSGAVGLAARARDHLLVVANWDSRSLDFYASNGKPLQDDACRFSLALSWHENSADKTAWQPDRVFASYQSVNLVTDARQRVYLIGSQTSPAGADHVDLYEVDVDDARGSDFALRKLASAPMRLGADNHFRFAGGVWVHDQTISILSSPGDFQDALMLNWVTASKP